MSKILITGGAGFIGSNLCDYFVMPSKFEAYGLVFAEALIYGLPCIGKKCYARPEFINNENGTCPFA